jgi:hypothetical protein
MYIVQIKNPQRHSWKELPETKCRFRALHKAIALHDAVKRSPTYAGMDVRIWCEASDHRVELDH